MNQLYNSDWWGYAVNRSTNQEQVPGAPGDANGPERWRSPMDASEHERPWTPMVAGEHKRPKDNQREEVVYSSWSLWPTGITIASLVSNVSSCLILLYKHLLVPIVVDPLALPNLTPLSSSPLVLETSLLVVRGPRFVIRCLLTLVTVTDLTKGHYTA
jgi:hypothetical protein